MVSCEDITGELAVGIGRFALGIGVAFKDGVWDGAVTIGFGVDGFGVGRVFLGTVVGDVGTVVGDADGVGDGDFS